MSEIVIVAVCLYVQNERNLSKLVVQKITDFILITCNPIFSKPNTNKEDVLNQLQEGKIEDMHSD